MSAEALEIAQTIAVFDPEMKSTLHPGELEAITIMKAHGEEGELHFCSGDAKAIEALSNFEFLIKDN